MPLQPTSTLQGKTATGPVALPVALLVAAFVAFWTLRAVVSTYNLDTFGDMVENYAWGIGWQFGYYKHPPFFAWLTAAWFSVFPRNEAAYYLLSMTSIALALLAMWRIATRFFDRPRQLLILIAAFFLPPLTFLAQNYNATSAMVPLWALTFLLYLRLFERRSTFDALLLGVFAGLAILAKYHSVLLLAALATHALFDREARPLWATRLPFVALLAFAATVGPHALWMVHTDFLTVRYAAEQGTGSWADTLVDAAEFFPAMLLYMVPALIPVLLAVPRFPRRAELGRGWQALTGSIGGRALIAAALVPAALTLVLGLVLNAELSSLWSIPFFVFIPLLLVALLAPAPGPLRLDRALIALAIYTAAVLSASPLIERRTLATARGASALPVDRIADAAQDEWHRATGRRFAIAAGDGMIANAAAFYATDRPYAIQQASLALTPWVTAEDIARDGALYLCSTESDEVCRRQALALFGRIDRELMLEMPAPAGAGGPALHTVPLFFRLPSG
ncbi:MAG: glycosyltransferase family 39 protein [Mesorhizobium sp.]